MSVRERIHRFLARPMPYRVRDFRNRERLRPDYRLVASLLLEQLDFESVLDVGCANGFLLRELQTAGKRVAGIEVAGSVWDLLPPSLRQIVEIGDFTEASGSWDLVCCVEVAEHIDPLRSPELVATLTGVARHWIYFTAAPPGQGGHGHINCRPHAEWMGWFREQGFDTDVGRTASLRQGLEALETAVWLRGNSFVLARLPTPSATVVP